MARITFTLLGNPSRTPTARVRSARWATCKRRAVLQQSAALAATLLAATATFVEAPTAAAGGEALGAALLREATYGNVSSVRALLAQKADPNVRDARGYTPLIRAALRGHRAVADELLAHGAAVNAQDREGYTALMRAAWRGYTETVTLLLQHGADPNLRTQQDFTALHLAAWGGFTATVRALLVTHPDVNVQDRAPHQGYTALLRAAAEGNTEIVRLLLTAGARVDLKTSEGATALDLARAGNHVPVVQLLCARINDPARACSAPEQTPSYTPPLPSTLTPAGRTY
jgi:ankyrin repeat protein